VLILDVARQIAAATGRGIDIEFTGLRPGEKLHEDLWGTGEVDERPVHPLVSHVAVSPLEATELRALAEASGPIALRLALTSLSGMSEVVAVAGSGRERTASRPRT